VSAQSIQPSPPLGVERVRERFGLSVSRRRVPAAIRVASTGELHPAGVPAAADQRRRAQGEFHEVLTDANLATAPAEPDHTRRSASS
jgi:hypothetical protein